MELHTCNRILTAKLHHKKTGFMERLRIEHRHLDIQLDQSRQAVNGFSKVDWLGIEVTFSTLASGRIMAAGSRKKSGAQHQRIFRPVEGDLAGRLVRQLKLAEDSR
ncbi:hypothetical protein [Pseudomonas sp. CC6-YY-74]|uniref:hypothetical protein n=1 Tax=Pseudomonas sp. CC6-YY-74 TaxID=1930532 RepID=UPI0012AB3338|nr:hypothetical protein [Pseudomonas sp. CC6-YY-74]